MSKTQGSANRQEPKGPSMTDVASSSMHNAESATQSENTFRGSLSPSTSHLSPLRTSTTTGTIRRASGSLAASSSKSDPLLLRCRAVAGAKHDPAKTVAALDDLVKLYHQTRRTESKTSGSSNVGIDAKGKRPATEEDVKLDVFRREIERTLVQARSLATRQYIDGLEGLVNALDILDSEIDSIKQACEDVQKKYSLARTSSKHLLSQTSDLQSERENLELQRSLTSLFLERFTLKPEEEAVIASKEPDISTSLFEVMDRLERIRQEARVLLEGSITSSPGAATTSDPAKTNARAGGGAGIRAGVDVMDTTARQLDAAYGKIARWLTFEFRQPVREGMEVSDKTKEAIKRVHAGGRADLLEPALATLSATRASYMSNSFQMALTVGGPPPSNLPRPIELHAHDPLRYVGDMLAWVHQALASEREFLTALFSENDGEFGGRRIGQRRRGLEGSLDMRASDTASSLAEEAKDGSLKLTAAERATRQMLDKSLDGCCRPLRTRILQTVRSQEGCIVTFKLANLIDFYRLTIARTLGSKAALSQTLSETGRATYEAFAVTLDKQASGLTRFNELPDHSLGIPPPLQGAGTTLKELMNVLKSSFGEEGDENSLDQQARHDALKQLELMNTKLVNPIVAMCERLAVQMVAKRPRGKSEQAANWDRSIFLCNCLEHIQAILAPYAFEKAQIDAIRTKEDEQARSLVDAHYQTLLVESHLAPLITIIEKQEAGSALAHQPSASPDDVSGTLAKFNEFLASQSVLSSSHLNLLNSPALRVEIHQKALAEVAGAYGKIVRAVEQPSNRYEWRETLIKRSEQEVRLLLGV